MYSYGFSIFQNQQGIFRRDLSLDKIKPGQGPLLYKADQTKIQYKLKPEIIQRGRNFKEANLQY